MKDFTELEPIPVELRAKWTLDEGPTIASAKRRNDEGLCCHFTCNNKLSDPADTAYFGLKVCKECREKLDAIIKRVQLVESFEEQALIKELVTAPLRGRNV